MFIYYLICYSYVKTFITLLMKNDHHKLLYIRTMNDNHIYFIVNLISKT